MIKYDEIDDMTKNASAYTGGNILTGRFHALGYLAGLTLKYMTIDNWDLER